MTKTISTKIQIPSQKPQATKPLGGVTPMTKRLSLNVKHLNHKL